MVLGHDLSKGKRTQDIKISEDVSFDTMLLRSSTLEGLQKSGFLKPSPIQLHGIPLGKCGFDLLLEAKSGTGKTAVFTVIALEKLELNDGIQTIILAPTREIASQISDVIREIGSQFKGLHVAVVMGGLPIKEDIEKFNENVHIVVGSPGRLRYLIQDNHVDVSRVRLLVLDEADKLMEKSFKPDINYIFSRLPKQKQVIMSSATYPDEAKKFTSKYVQKAQHICPDSNSVLLGIEQKVTIVPHHSNIIKQTKHRYEELIKILNGKQFKQCLIFCNYQVRVGELHRMLSRDKWPAEQLYGKQEQIDRLDALKTLQEYKCRVLVSTDLAARGIDASNVDVVINFEPSFEWQTYLHRIGRAGRYGSYGTAITILSEGKEEMKFKQTLGLTNMPFDLRNFWDDEPFNLSLTVRDDFHDEDTAPVTVYSKKTLKEDGSNMLWELLTTDLGDKKDSTMQEMSSFADLCNSFKKSNIESFSELMHSFAVNKNKCKQNLSRFQYKHVKVSKLPIDINGWDKLEANGSNTSSDPATEFKVMNNNINGDSNGKESVHKENETLSSDSPVLEGASNSKISMTNNLHSENIEKDIDKKDVKESVQHKHNVNRFENLSNETELCPSKQALLDAGLPTAFGKTKTKSHYIHSFKTHDSNNNENRKLSKAKLQHRPTNEQYSNGKGVKNISFHNSLTNINNKTYCSSDTGTDTDLETVESDDYSSSYDEWTEAKARNDHSMRHVHHGSCLQTHSKRNQKNLEQSRGLQFDLWYSQLKYQMQYIQYTLYIEELRKV